MTAAHTAAVIFDVDGPLLDLTAPEEDAFFAAFEIVFGLTGLSSDWDSYQVRNDENIIKEILENHLGRAPNDDEYAAILNAYENHMREGYRTGALQVSAIPGALDLLKRLFEAGGIALGTATANVRHAAEIRLEAAGMWHMLKGYPGTADGGGAKRDVLARVIADLDLPKERIVFLGDNLNDLDAGRANGVHFIGFHVEQARRQRLRDAGARITCGDHGQTHDLIESALNGL